MQGVAARAVSFATGGRGQSAEAREIQQQRDAYLADAARIPEALEHGDAQRHLPLVRIEVLDVVVVVAQRAADCVGKLVQHLRILGRPPHRAAEVTICQPVLAVGLKRTLLRAGTVVPVGTIV